MSKLHRSLSDCGDSCCETATANMATRNRLKQEMHGNAASENLIRICNYLYIKDIRIKGRTHNPSISGSSPTVKPWGITLLGKRSVPMDFFWALESVGIGIRWSAAISVTLYGWIFSAPLRWLLVLFAAHAAAEFWSLPFLCIRSARWPKNGLGQNSLKQ